MVQPKSEKEMYSMTKTDLAQVVSDLTGCPEKATTNILNTTMETIQNALQRGDSVTLPGFGTFSVSHRAPRKGRDMKTGEPIEIPAHSIPSFRPGKKLKDAVRR